MIIDIKDGAETRTITTGPEADTYVGNMAADYNAANGTSLTRAQYVRQVLIQLGQNWLDEGRRKRKENLLVKFEAADETKKAAAEAAVS